MDAGAVRRASRGFAARDSVRRHAKAQGDASRSDAKAPTSRAGAGFPYVRDNVTKLKLIVPVGKAQTWRLIATPEGLASWFPLRCRGTVEVGESIAFAWRDGTTDRFRVLRVGDAHSSFAIEWRHGAIQRYYLHGRRTTLTLEVEYPADSTGRGLQVRELPQWAFRLANLKSVALGGKDLRQSTWIRSWTDGFID